MGIHDVWNEAVIFPSHVDGYFILKLLGVIYVSSLVLLLLPISNHIFNLDSGYLNICSNWI